MSVPVEQLVLDYLARASQSAQRHLGSSERLAFITRLRARIEEHRARSGAVTAQPVGRGLERFGEPERLVLRERDLLRAAAAKRAAEAEESKQASAETSGERDRPDARAGEGARDSGPDDGQDGSEAGAR